MRLDDHFGSGSTLQRNERVKLAASLIVDDVAHDCPRAASKTAAALPRPQAHPHSVTKTWQRRSGSMTGRAL